MAIQNNDVRSDSLIPFGFKPFAVILSFVLLGILGFVVMPVLPLRLYPSETGHQIYISFSMPGYKPDVVEMEATAPIESVISLIDGIERIESTSGEGWGEIVVEAAKGIDVERVKRSIVAAIRQIYPNLPQLLLFPEISDVSQSENFKKQLLVYTLWSNKPTWQLKQIAAEKIIPHLTSLEGIASIEIHGASDLIYQIRLNPDAMEKHNLSPSSIAMALRDYTLNEGVGQTITQSGNCIAVSVRGPELGTNFDSIAVALVNGRVIRLGQIAYVEQIQRDTERVFRINGKPAVYLIISSIPEVNQIKLANSIYDEFESIANGIKDLSYSKTFDSTVQLRSDLKRSIIRTIASLSLLMVFVVLAYRKLRYVFIIGVCLLINIAIACLLYFIFRIEIHLFSLSGLALSLGLIIDNTLVTLDHLRGKGNMKIFTALLAATLTTIAALATIFLIEGKMMQNLVDFAWVIIISLSVSLIIALFLTPALFQLFPVLEATQNKTIPRIRVYSRIITFYKKYCHFAHSYRWIGLVIGIWIIGIPIFLLPDKIEGNTGLASLYNSTIGSNTYQYSIKPVLDKALGGTLRLFYNSAWRNQMWEIPERTKLTVIYKLPQGTTLEQANAIAKIFESYILSEKGVETLITNVNKKRGTLEIYFDREAEKTSYPFELKAKLERLSLTQAAADFYIFGVGLGFSNSTSSSFANSIIVLKGYSYKMLMAYAKQFADSIANDPRVKTVWITGGQEWLFVDQVKNYAKFNSEPSLLRSIDGSKLFQSISSFSGNNEWFGWMPIAGKVQALKITPDTDTPSDFEFDQHIITSDSVSFRLGNITSISSRKITDNIYRENQQYVLTLAYNYIGPDKLVEKTLKKNLERINASLPVGFTAKTPYNNWFYEKNFWSYYLVGVMLLFIYIISAALFESLIQPFAVIMVVPLSFVGCFITYWLFNLPFDQGTIASFMLLGGLVVNSVIYILNEQNNLTKNKRGNVSSKFVKAFRFKLIPIVLTILSTILGLLPFVVYGEEPFWYSLALGTIGGLAFSALVLIIFMPFLPGVLKRK